MSLCLKRKSRQRSRLQSTILGTLRIKTRRISRPIRRATRQKALAWRKSCAEYWSPPSRSKMAKIKALQLVRVRNDAVFQTVRRVYRHDQPRASSTSSMVDAPRSDQKVPIASSTPNKIPQVRHLQIPQNIWRWIIMLGTYPKMKPSQSIQNMATCTTVTVTRS